MKKFVVLSALIAALSPFSSLHAATRTVQFTSITQSTMRTEEAGSGKVFLTCMVTLRNVSTATAQNITNFTMNVYASVPGAAAIQPAVLTMQTGSVAGASAWMTSPALRYYQFCGESSCGIGTSTVMPAVGTPVVLATRGAGNLDSVHFRGVASFQYQQAGAYNRYDDGATLPPTNQNIMYTCAGSVTVADPAATPGAVIATGVAEAVSNDYQQPSIQNGLSNIPAGPAPAGVTAVTTQFDAQNSGAEAASNTCAEPPGGHAGAGMGCMAWAPGPYGCDNPAGFTLYQTGPGCGSDGGHADLWGIFYLNWAAPNDKTPCRFGGTKDWSGLQPAVPAPSAADIVQIQASVPVAGEFATNNLTAFPQFISNIPFPVNGGRPF